MSGPSETNGRAELSEDGSGVLANLPRTRPQRASARRAAARRSSAKAVEAKAPAAEGNSAAPTPGSTARKAPAKARSAAAKPAKRPARPKAPRPARRAVAETVPRQGFECEEERATGAVQPPGGTELVSTAAEILSELTKAGISGGERLLRDVISRLPR